MYKIAQIKLKDDQRAKLKQMNELEYNDDVMNKFKLIIYKWDIEKAIKYYKNDQFCKLFCIDADLEYGCNKGNSCKLLHTYIHIV